MFPPLRTMHGNSLIFFLLKVLYGSESNKNIKSNIYEYDFVEN